VAGTTVRRSDRKLYASVTAASLVFMTTGMLAGPALAAAPSEVGTAAPGGIAFTFVGAIEQNATIIVNVGYITSMAGLDESWLFTGEDPLERSAATARFTYFTSGSLETRSILDNLFETTGTAETTYYYQPDGGASFDDPTSFRQGTPIAVATSAWHNLVNVQAPDKGLITAESDDLQVSADPFTLDGQEHTFGAADRRIRLSFTGEGLRSDAEAPRASVLYAGEATSLGGGDAPGAVASPADESGSDNTAIVIAVIALVVALGSGIMSMRRPGGPSAP
jgi:hypothetical protein